VDRHRNYGAQAVRLLTTAMRYGVPEQDLSIDLSRMPAISTSCFVVRQVQRVHLAA
jgi:fatty-acid peroxygenase